MSQASQHFRSSEKQAACEGCFARQSICSVTGGKKKDQTKTKQKTEFKNGMAVRWEESGVSYWTVQAGLLTPLTFARHRLSPLAAFTSGAYFLHNGRR